MKTTPSLSSCRALCAVARCDWWVSSAPSQPCPLVWSGTQSNVSSVALPWFASSLVKQRVRGVSNLSGGRRTCRGRRPSTRHSPASKPLHVGLAHGAERFETMYSSAVFIAARGTPQPRNRNRCLAGEGAHRGRGAPGGAQHCAAAGAVGPQRMKAAERDWGAQWPN
jgi:hypothetical protein